MKTTPIYLSELEAKQFIQFQKHYALIGLLESMDAFALRGGSVTIHFGIMGEIKTIEKHEYYRT